jgi:Cu+-exporting ATPase
MMQTSTSISALSESVDRLAGEGKTAMFVASTARPAGIVAVADPIKASAADAIRALHDKG